MNILNNTLRNQLEIALVKLGVRSGKGVTETDIGVDRLKKDDFSNDQIAF